MKQDEWVLPAAVAAAATAAAEKSQRLAALSREIQQIPAPTGQEQLRAGWVQDAFRRMALADVGQDEVYNVYGRIPGQRSDVGLLVSAHTDTVFPAETDLTVREDPQADRIYGPGIGDNAAGVAGLVLLAEELMAWMPPTGRPPLPVDIWLVATSSEEGLGDLRGAKAALDRLSHRIGACIMVEGVGLGRIVHRALGSKRLRIESRAPGGHSWGDFGATSAIHLLARLAADLVQIKVAGRPKSSFNIGRIWGGISVNTIAPRAGLELDMRSESPEELERLLSRVLATVERYRQIVAHQPDVEIHVTVIGDRPAGDIPADHFLVRAGQAALAHAGYAGTPELRMSSTDANVPLSRHIPAVCVGLTTGGDAHRPGEWINPSRLGQGLGQLLVLVWWTAEWLATT